MHRPALCSTLEFEPMRIAVVLAAAVLALPVPVLAQDRGDDAGRIAGALGDPVVQAQAAAVAGALAGAVLDTPIAPLARAAKAMEGQNPDYVDPDLRVGDVVGPAAAEAPRVIAERLPQMMGAMAGMSDAIADLIPRLAAIGEQARAAAEGYRR